MFIKKLLAVAIFIAFYAISSAQTIEVYPTHWWVNMKNQNLQLMVHSKDIADKIPMIKMTEAGIKLADGVVLKKIERVENSNYIFFDLVIDKTAKPGNRSFSFGNGR